MVADVAEVIMDVVGLLSFSYYAVVAETEAQTVSLAVTDVVTTDVVQSSGFYLFSAAVVVDFRHIPFV